LASQKFREQVALNKRKKEWLSKRGNFINEKGEFKTLKYKKI
jgi:hypothetical protein